ncbi:MAG: ATP-binding protein [Acidobacteriota bacterium]
MSRISIRVAANLAGIRTAADALEAFQAEHGLPGGNLWPIHVALDEILSNIVRHGVAGQEDRFVDVTFALMDRSLEVTVVDDGPELNPLALPEPDLVSPLEQRRVGGLGVHLVTHLMERVDYRRLEGRNRLVMTFRGAEIDASGREKG